MTKQELKSMERDLLLIQRRRSEVTEKLRRMLKDIDDSSMMCTTLKLMITDLRKRINKQKVLK